MHNATARLSQGSPLSGVMSAIGESEAGQLRLSEAELINKKKGERSLKVGSSISG